MQRSPDCGTISVMKDETARRLNNINRAFYAQIADDFSETRQQAWPGWKRLLSALPAQDPLRILDAGCGNGRFGVFLAHGDPLRRWTYLGIDSSFRLLSEAACSLRASAGVKASFVQQDLVFTPLPQASFDVVAAFGLLHHIPGMERRAAFVRALAERTAPNGLLCIAAWRFYDYARFRQRIVPWSAALEHDVETGDYLLDWRRGGYALRYCHAIDDDEFTALIAASGLRLIDRYRADGFSGAVNEYALLAAS